MEVQALLPGINAPTLWVGDSSDVSLCRVSERGWGSEGTEVIPLLASNSGGLFYMKQKGRPHRTATHNQGRRAKGVTFAS